MVFRYIHRCGSAIIGTGIEPDCGAAQPDQGAVGDELGTVGVVGGRGAVVGELVDEVAVVDGLVMGGVVVVVVLMVVEVGATA